MNQTQTRFRASLSAAGLKNLSPAQANDFTFITPAGKLPCPSFVAEFLSPKIAKFRGVDCTYCCYSVLTGDQSSNNDFEEFLGLGRGFSIDVDSHNIDYIRLISEEFENQELYDIVCANQELTVDNVVSLMKHRHESFGAISREVEFAAEHITELSGQCFVELKCSILREILRHRKMRIDNEDWLFDVVMSSIEVDRSKIELLEFIYFEMLNSSSMKRFTELDFEHFSGFNREIWERLCGRLVMELSRDSKEYSNRYRELCDRYGAASHQFNPNAPFKGIIWYLTTKYGGNVHDRRIIEVTQSSEFNTSGSYGAKNCVDLHSSSFSLTSNQPNQWLSFDFKCMRVKATHYSIRTRTDIGANSFNPRSWLIEVSDEGASWREVSRETEDQNVNGANLSHTFSISNPMMGRFLRFRQIATHCQRHYLTLQRVELFGDLQEWGASLLE
jgi:hypothetical protein